MADFVIAKGNTLPQLTATLRDGQGTALDLTGATVKLFMRDPASGTMKINGATVPILSPVTAGRVQYAWSASDVDTVKSYAAYFEVTYAGPKTLNVPNQSQLVIDVLDPAELLSATLAYSDLDDLREFGVTSRMADDEEARAVLLMTSRFVDDYCGTASGWFGAATASTKTFHNVRRPELVLPRPFSAITNVEINDRVIASTAYQITGYGLFLGTAGILDVDGFPLKTYTQLPYVLGWPYGSRVEVTATWGYSSVPLPIRRATTILASRAVQDTALNQIPGAALRSITIEGYTRTFAAPYELVPNSTGSYEVDLLLKAYRKDLVLCG